MYVVQQASKGVCGTSQRSAHLHKTVHANPTLPQFCSRRLQVHVELNALDCILQFQRIDIHMDERLIQPEMETTLACSSSNSDSTMQHIAAWSTQLLKLLLAGVNRQETCQRCCGTSHTTVSAQSSHASSRERIVSIELKTHTLLCAFCRHNCIWPCLPSALAGAQD